MTKKMNLSAKLLASGLAVGVMVTLANAAPKAQLGVGDPVAGRSVYARCQSCHSLVPGRNQMGPSLAGVVGRKAGTVAGYSYSPAMTKSSVVWNAPTLDRFLAKPSAVVPGNKMSFAGMPSAKDRADVIAFMRKSGK